MSKLVRLGSKAAKAGRKVLTIVKRVLAKLNWTGVHKDDIYKAKHIQAKLTGNPLFPVPYPDNVTSLADLGNHIVDYDKAIAANEAHVEGSAEALKLAGDVVHADLISIMSMVQDAMDDDKPNAIKIATDAGFETKYETSHGPRKAQVNQCTEQGCLIVWGEGGGPHDWQMSRDGGQSFENKGGTSAGILEVTGEKSDVRIWFRSRQIFTRGKFGEWGPWVSGMPL